MLPKAESAEQVRQAIAAMRFKSKGGTRPDDRRQRAGVLGLSEAEYRRRADVWPLNPEGELINWTIIESKEGLAKVREIAAVKGIGVLWPGAGTLRGVFTTTNAAGERVFDEKGWEGAIQQVLAACKEFNVAVRLPRQSERHRDAHEAGLQRVRDELGRRRLQGHRDRAQGRQSAADQRLTAPLTLTDRRVMRSLTSRPTCQRHALSDRSDRSRRVLLRSLPASGLSRRVRTGRQFRGPGGQGHSSERGLPADWSEDEERRLEDAGAGHGLVVAGRRRRPRLADGRRGRAATSSLRALAFDVETGPRGRQRRGVPT